MVNYREIERNTYDEMIKGRNVHDHLKNMTVEELYKFNKETSFSFSVLCFNLTGDLNVGTIIRSSILHGAESVTVFGRKKFDTRGTVGSHHYIDVTSVYGFNEDGFTFDRLKFKEILEPDKFHNVFIEQGGNPLQNYRWECPIDKKIRIIVGNETNGIPVDMMTGFDIVSIPQRGVIRSFNVSTAFSMAAWDMRCKRDMF